MNDSPRVEEGDEQLRALQRLDQEIREEQKRVAEALRQAIGDAGNVDGLREGIENCSLYEPGDLDLSERELQAAQALIELRKAMLSKDAAELQAALATCDKVHHTTDEVMQDEVKQGKAALREIEAADKVRRRLAAVALALLVIQFGFLVFGVLSLLPRGDEYDEEREHLKDVRKSELQ